MCFAAMASSTRPQRLSLSRPRREYLSERRAPLRPPFQRCIENRRFMLSIDVVLSVRDALSAAFT